MPKVDNHLQQYYLAGEKSALASNSSKLNFQQLLQKKISIAMNLNDFLNEDDNRPLPSNLFSSLMPMMNEGSGNLSLPMMSNSSPYMTMLDSYKKQMESPLLESQYDSSN